MRNRAFILAAAAAFLLLSPRAKAQHVSAADDPMIAELLPFTPANVIAGDKALNLNGKFNPDDVDIFYMDPAYLDGPGTEPYIIAYFSAQGGESLAVLRAGAPPVPIFHLKGPVASAGPVILSTADFDGDGKPYVIADYYTMSRNKLMLVYKWTGDALVPVPAPKPPDPDGDPNPYFLNADVEPATGNGTLQVVEGPCVDLGSREDCSRPYKIYTYSNGAFHLAFTSKTDPSGFIGPDGTPDITIAKLTRVRPDKVTRAEIQHAIAAGSGDGDRDDDGDDVTIRIGDLSQPFSKSLAPVYADQIDLSTLFIGAGVHPTSAVVRGRDEDDWGSALGKNKHFNGPFVGAKFPRLPFLKMLASQIADGKFEMPPDRDRDHGDQDHNAQGRDDRGRGQGPDLNGLMLVRFNIDGKMKGGGGFHTIGLITVVGGAPTAADHSHGRH